MNPHPRIRKTIKWGGAVVTVLLILCWRGVVAISIGITDHLEIYLGAGVVGTIRSSLGPPYSRPLGLHVWLGPEASSLELLRSIHGAAIVRLFPVWPVAACCVVLTLVAWRLDTLARRRAKLNLCPKCNYDRTGLAAGSVCPECGAAASINA